MRPIEDIAKESDVKCPHTGGRGVFMIPQPPPGYGLVDPDPGEAWYKCEGCNCEWIHNELSD